MGGGEWGESDGFLRKNRLVWRILIKEGPLVGIGPRSVFGNPAVGDSVAGGEGLRPARPRWSGGWLGISGVPAAFCYNDGLDNWGRTLSAGATRAREPTAKKPVKAAGEVPRRFGTLVRIADDVAADAKSVAALRGTSMAEYLSDTLRPILKRTIIDELNKRSGGREPASIQQTIEGALGRRKGGAK